MQLPLDSQLVYWNYISDEYSAFITMNHHNLQFHRHVRHVQHILNIECLCPQSK